MPAPRVIAAAPRCVLLTESASAAPFRRTLADVLAEGPLPEEQVWRFLRQLLGGLQHVHSHGITHRDLKPKNIFVDFGDNLKLGDFGLAAGDIADKPRSAEDDEEAPVPPGSAHAGGAASGRAAADGSAGGDASGGDKKSTTEHTADVGTYLYMDPHWRGKHSPPFDIYSVGIIAFELCSFFNTGMERVVALSDLRRGKLPDGFEAKWPSASSMRRDSE